MENYEVDTRTESAPDGREVTVATIKGAIGAGTSASFEEDMTKLFSGGVRHLVFDCTDLEYMNSTGTGVMVKILDKFEEADGTVVLANVPKKITDLMDILGLLEVFAIHDSVEKAVAAG